MTAWYKMQAMDITYLGHSSFRIRGKTVSVVTDPYANEATGLKFPKHVTAEVVTVSTDLPDHNAVSQVEGSPYVVSGPGEYEVKTVGIVGVAKRSKGEQADANRRHVMFRIEVEGVSFLHLGDVNAELTADEVSALDGIDVLFVPVGGDTTLDAAGATKLVGELSPSVVIPMHYGRADLDQKRFGALAPVEAFLKEMGKEGVVPQPKLSLTKDKIPDVMQVVVLA